MYIPFKLSIFSPSPCPVESCVPVQTFHISVSLSTWFLGTSNEWPCSYKLSRSLTFVSKTDMIISLASFTSSFFPETLMWGSGITRKKGLHETFTPPLYSALRPMPRYKILHNKPSIYCIVYV